MFHTRFIRLSVMAGFLSFAVAACSSAGTGQQIPSGSQTIGQDGAIPDVTHNKWSAGTPIPTAVLLPAAGAIGTKIYVAGGATAAKVATAKLQIYDTASKTWTTGAPMHTARWDPSGGAVVNGIFYALGGATSLSTFTKAVEAYDPTTNTWTRKKAMPIANAPVAAVVGADIYAIGGYDIATNQRLASVYKYDTVANKWSKVASMHDGRSNPAVGTIGSTIVAAYGLDNSGITTDNEAYSATANSWTTKASGPTATTGPCSGVSGGRLYVAGGESGGASAPAINVVDAYTLKTNGWASKATMPQAVVGPGSAVINGKLYCIAGASSGNPRLGGVVFYNNVQVYQP